VGIVNADHKYCLFLHLLMFWHLLML